MAAIETFELTKIYPKVVAVEGLSISVPERCCFGFLGPNGAGKTTTMKMLTGLTYPTYGTARILGWSILTEMGKIRKVIGYLPAYAPKPKGKALDLIVSLASLNCPADKVSLKRHAKDLLEMFGLWEVRNKKVHTFSMGMFKKWLLALTLMGEPEIVLLDEPTANLDPVGRAELLDLIEGLSKERTIFLNSHVLPEVERVADHVAVINEGKLVVQGTVEQLQEMVRGTNYVYTVRTMQVEELKTFLEGSNAVLEIKPKEDGLELITSNPEAVWVELVKAYQEAGIIVTEFKEVRKSMEEIFLKLIMGEEEEAG